MGYEGDEFSGTVHPEYARMPPLDSMRTIRAPIFKINNHVDIAIGSPPINIGFNANKTGENEFLKYIRPWVETDFSHNSLILI